MSKTIDSSRYIVIDDELVNKMRLAIEAALAYEAETGGKRKLGITGEVGEILVCRKLGLRLMLDTRSEGFDALDKVGKKIEIKTRRSESLDSPRDSGRTSRFSEYPFDYALLVLLDRKYRLHEVWRANYKDIWPIIQKEKRRNPSLASFKSKAERIFLAD